jgi:LmbE family N-acetylglucosaminyl deacetylase
MQPLSIINCKRILALGAHADDLEIGLYGTLQKLLKAGATIDCILLSGSEERQVEQKKSYQEMGLIGKFAHFSFQDGLFPSQLPEIKAAIKSVIEGETYDLVFTHNRQDHHQDHYSLGHLAYNLFRDTTILEYEIPKFDVDTPQPNVFIPLSEAEIDAKVHHLERNFASQASKAWYTAETFRGLARLRGVQCNASYAEAFICRKVVLKI